MLRKAVSINLKIAPLNSHILKTMVNLWSRLKFQEIYFNILQNNNILSVFHPSG